MGLALKCDETEASRSENTLQNVKNYKITRKCQKKYIFAQTIFTHFLGQYHLGYIDEPKTRIIYSTLRLAKSGMM